MPDDCTGGCSGLRSRDLVADPTLRWFAVHTQPRREAVAEKNLERLCAAVFYPRYRKRTIIHGYRRTVSVPLFPGYLFASFAPAGRLRAVHYCMGVHGVVFLGGEPAEVPVDLIEAIEARIRDGHVVFDPSLEDGQRVEVVAGPFRGYTGLFDAVRSDRERVAILLDSLSFNARMVLDRAEVRAF